MSFPRFLTRIHTLYINKAALRFVGHTAIADLEHVGRRTHRVHHTPVRAYRTGDKVVIGLNFGRQSDWIKNIEAAQRCRMRLGDQVMELAEPRIVPIEQGVKGVPKVYGLGLRHLVRTRDCVELSVVGSVPAPAGRCSSITSSDSSHHFRVSQGGEMRLVDVLARVFEEPADHFTDDSSQDTVINWTSLGHVALLTELERSYGVRFSNDEMTTMHCVGDIRSVLTHKGVQPS
jgi:deazaflavin-dependent oxidoreductase (nitroreductase family)